ncbi:hypothetical protein FOS14_10730 [Skermania sp. ID1734]|uniref:hypothetical protein n=1 Tax=Skermania sp. ID1734 TaxID=2597516 RepID=UPI001180995F|nr:hypothetical protein [Skermania sp. ID1734]TSD99730.1 hypothetical protein FOS14_10730 [Skermania sp. ID1734]
MIDRNRRARRGSSDGMMATALLAIHRFMMSVVTFFLFAAVASVLGIVLSGWLVVDWAQWKRQRRRRRKTRHCR